MIETEQNTTKPSQTYFVRSVFVSAVFSPPSLNPKEHTKQRLFSRTSLTSSPFILFSSHHHALRSSYRRCCASSRSIPTSLQMARLLPNQQVENLHRFPLPLCSPLLFFFLSSSANARLDWCAMWSIHTMANAILILSKKQTQLSLRVSRPAFGAARLMPIVAMRMPCARARLVSWAARSQELPRLYLLL